MKKTILAIDDNESITFSVKEQLITINPEWEIIIANSGKDGLDVLKKTKVDLVLLDIMMPEMDGWDVASEIKNNDITKKTPVIFLTAKTDDLSKGMSKLSSEDYIEKPFDMFDLDKRIKLVLGIKP